MEGKALGDEDEELAPSAVGFVDGCGDAVDGWAVVGFQLAAERVGEGLLDGVANDVATLGAEQDRFELIKALEGFAGRKAP